MTFELHIRTPEEIAAETAEARAARLKAECRARIEARLDDKTAQNLLVARLRAALSADQLAAFDAAEDWKLATIAECRRAIAEGDDPVWPEWPGGAADALVAAV
jgi:hypothetical protein